MLVFDRPVEASSASDTQAYSIPDNRVAFAKPQLSGRLVFATLEQPEGPNAPTTISVSGLADRRGASRSAVVPLQSRLLRGGAWVSGQVREADGTPVDQGSVVYSNIVDDGCALGGRPQPLARVPLGSNGSYEIRYVRQGSCGFEVTAADAGNVELRRLEARVRRAGERMSLDIVLLGEGAVEGFVRDLAGAVVAGATVVATSETDRYRGGSAVSDAAGFYRIEGLPVGLVSVKAGRGAGLGSATGRIERAGTAARVNVTLDAGAVTVSGYFWQVKDGEQLPVASALMSFLVAGGAAGYVFTDEAGFYRFDGMPVGSFSIQGRGNGPFGEAGASATGSATAGQSVTLNLVHVAKSEAVLGRVSGKVVFPGGGGGAAGVIVAQDVSTAFIQDATGTDAEGNFVLEGLPTGVNVSIGAITLDRRRTGHGWAFIPPDTQEQSGIVITLSAIGTATFTVKGPNGVLPNQEVALLGVGGFAGVCRNPCGCKTGTTNASGQVSFADLPLGGYTAQVVRREGSFTEAATGTAVITSESVPGFGLIQLLGSGTVKGTVSLDSAHATFTGGSVALASRAFVNDGLFTCGMVSQESHRGQVNPATSVYEFKNVAVGPVSATGRADIGVATSKGNLARAGDVLTLDLLFVDTVAGELSGRVFLPSGVPAGAGVEVTVNGPLPDVTVSTDPDSHFAFAKVLPEGNYSITARDPFTGGVVREFVYLRRGQDLLHDLKLKGRGTVRVRVEDALGAAVDRAFVTLREQDFPQRRHDRSIEPTLLGVATFEDVFEGPFSVEVRDIVGRGGRGSGAVPAPGASVDVTVSLNPTGSVTGTFSMPDGTTPIPYALVTLRVSGRAVGQTTTPGSGELIGRYSFDYVPAGPVRVEAEDPLTLRTGFAVGAVESATTLELPVIAKGLGKVTGEVRARLAGDDYEVRPGASVKIEAGSYKGATLADASGHYEFAGVPEGPVTVTASVGTQALMGSATGSILEDGQTLELHVYLRDAGHVSGHVFRSDGETPRAALEGHARHDRHRRRPPGHLHPRRRRLQLRPGGDRPRDAHGRGARRPRPRPRQRGRRDRRQRRRGRAPERRGLAGGEGPRRGRRTDRRRRVAERHGRLPLGAVHPRPRERRVPAGQGPGRAGDGEAPRAARGSRALRDGLRRGRPRPGERPPRHPRAERQGHRAGPARRDAAACLRRGRRPAARRRRPRLRAGGRERRLHRDRGPARELRPAGERPGLGRHRRGERPADRRERRQPRARRHRPRHGRSAPGDSRAGRRFGAGGRDRPPGDRAGRRRLGARPGHARPLLLERAGAVPERLRDRGRPRRGHAAAERRDGRQQHAARRREGPVGPHRRSRDHLPRAGRDDSRQRVAGGGQHRGRRHRQGLRAHGRGRRDGRLRDHRPARRNPLRHRHRSADGPRSERLRGGGRRRRGDDRSCSFRRSRSSAGR